MRCPECGAKVADNDIFCGNCNAELIAGGEAAVSQTVQEEQEKKIKKKRSGKKKPEEDTPKKTGAVLKIAAAVIVIAIVVVIIVLIASLFKTSKGKKIFDKVPLGRDIAMIESMTEEKFLIGEDSSAYGAFNYIADYDYICESEKSVDVDGIKLPEWAVVLKKDSSGNVDEATFYNFSILKYSWMGDKMASKIDASTVEYGMRIKTAERALGMKPYTIVKENEENTSTYAYRYHYTDEESGNNCVMNFYVVVDDSNNQVKYVYDEQLDYLNLILRGTTKSEEG